MIERGNPLSSLKEEQGHSNSSLETMKQNWDLSMESRSFLSRVNDQVRKRQKRSSMNVTEDDEKHSMIWGMYMSVTMESAGIHVKALPGQLPFHRDYKRSHIETNVRHIYEIGV